MPEVLGNPPSPRVALFWNGTAWQWALVDAAGQLQVDVIASGLPAGAATEATLATLGTEVTLEAVRVLLASLDGKDFATQVTLTALLTELQAKADLTETQPVSAAVLPLPVGAATEARLIITNTLLTQIATLRGALQFLATDRLIVRGEDQLHSFRGLLAVARTAAISGANGHIDSPPGLADRVWVITSVAVRDSTNAVTAVEMLQRHGADQFRFHNEVLALPAGQWYTLQCLKWMGEDDVIRIYLPGAQAGDSCIVNLTGHYMHKET